MLYILIGVVVAVVLIIIILIVICCCCCGKSKDAKKIGELERVGLIMLRCWISNLFTMKYNFIIFSFEPQIMHNFSIVRLRKKNTFLLQIMKMCHTFVFTKVRYVLCR